MLDLERTLRRPAIASQSGRWVAAPSSLRPAQMGEVSDFYFDIGNSIARYMAVDTGPWLFGRRVIISSHLLEGVSFLAEGVSVDLTREQLEDSPEIELDEPLSLERLGELHEHYGCPAYWVSDSPPEPEGEERAGER